MLQKTRFDCVVFGSSVLQKGALRKGWLALRDGIVVDAGNGRVPPAKLQIDAGGDAVGPAFVDTHIHGYGGHDASDCGDPEHGESALRAMARSLLKAGVGAFCPTLYPLDPDITIQCLKTIANVRRNQQIDESIIIGAHLEGPFVNPMRAGALEIAKILTPNLKLAETFIDTGAVSIMTIAPELKNTKSIMEACVRSGIIVSIGHSAATLAECKQACLHGASSITHLFNAMPPFHHRDFSIVNFALLEPGFPTELIGDLQHVGAPAIDVLIRTRGLDGIRLVSDNLAAAGTRVTKFKAGGHRLTVKNGIVYRAGGGIAGSCRSLASSVSGLSRTGLLTLEEAWRMASAEPARFVRPAAIRGFARIPLTEVVES
ncbi:MAG: N-acetylglucosamine-6-phosphate deacetylase [Planctomycetota bacterium]